MNTPVSAAPLAVFRIGFGLMMLLSVIRFWYNGWIEKLYLEPSYFFSYQYFAWVKPLGDWTYLLFGAIALSSVCILLGWKYRVATVVFFLSFTYVELMDKTTYLNHYYFVSLLSALMIFLPANARFSLDAGLNEGALVPRWTIDVLKLFVGVVYFYAGLAKLNTDWLLHAQPLAIWLPAKYSIPLLGDLLQERWVHFAFAWSGALYDLFIPFLLLYRPTRNLAFVAVVVFHVMTRVLFPIGMFPYIMIVSALIFFGAEWHERVLEWFRRFIGAGSSRLSAGLAGAARVQGNFGKSKKMVAVPRLASSCVVLLLAIHLLLPWRYLANDGELFWTEEGYRFSWRVMLMEKAGYLNYRLVDPATGKSRIVDPAAYLSTFQSKQLATQPDFILEFAHFLAEEEIGRTGRQPEVYAESYVALNGRASRLYVRKDVDLTTITEDAPRVTWLTDFNEQIYGI
ncbi:HTTM domain-containing protein [Neolewinella antarctica]|uniref:HTTM-like domain-containing protein n=1 Tax=Neolewinella antarctica TaxID=442734 RepID=A0ABX0X7R3_9BACT|nr:HTTM domain-containing protein [Neolewinella antarctica]NJC25041.1 hypothetical protein [Neolewinella antarctica]